MGCCGNKEKENKELMKKYQEQSDENRLKSAFKYTKSYEGQLSGNEYILFPLIKILADVHEMSGQYEVSRQNSKESRQDSKQQVIKESKDDYIEYLKEGLENEVIKQVKQQHVVIKIKEGPQDIMNAKVKTQDESIEEKSENQSIEVKSKDKSIKVKSEDESKEVKSEDQSIEVKSKDESIEEQSEDESIEEIEQEQNVDLEEVFLKKFSEEILEINPKKQKIKFGRKSLKDIETHDNLISDLKTSFGSIQKTKPVVSKRSIEQKRLKQRRWSERFIKPIFKKSKSMKQKVQKEFDEVEIPNGISLKYFSQEIKQRSKHEVIFEFLMERFQTQEVMEIVELEFWGNFYILYYQVLQRSYQL